MKPTKIAQLDLHDVPQMYHNLKYNDGEIYFADNITSIPRLMKQFKVTGVRGKFSRLNACTRPAATASKNQNEGVS